MDTREQLVIEHMEDARKLLDAMMMRDPGISQFIVPAMRDCEEVISLMNRFRNAGGEKAV